MQKWEYMAIASNEDGYVRLETTSKRVPEMEFFNMLGSEGWEMVAFRATDHPLFYFKRPKI